MKKKLAIIMMIFAITNTNTTHAHWWNEAEKKIERWFDNAKTQVKNAWSDIVDYTASFWSEAKSDKVQINDSSLLHETTVEKIYFPRTCNEIKAIVQLANATNKKIAIAGQKMSQGGHSFATNALVIDMSHFNQLLSINVDKKTVCVQAGITWDQLQKKLHPLQLAIKVMQSSHLFSVGGSLSANIHGRDPNYGPIIETIESFRIMTHAGEIIEASRANNSELFSLAIGGYGLFGIILNVTFSITDNTLSSMSKQEMTLEEYTTYLQTNILENSHIEQHYARLSPIQEHNSTQPYIVSTTFTRNEKLLKKYPKKLKDETFIHFHSWLLSKYKKFKFLKKLRWEYEKKFLSEGESATTYRNEIMRPYMDYALINSTSQNTNLLQEYFIPVENIASFANRLKEITRQYNINLLNVTLRYIPKNTESFLSYAQNNCIAFVLFFSTNTDPDSLLHVKSYVQELINAAHACLGKYYLPYVPYPTKEQLVQSYPQIGAFWKKKKQYDPNEIFINEFYLDYKF